MVQQLLQDANVRLQDLNAIAFGCGPGSFTGVRTACGIVQGLAFGAGVPVVPVVTLLAMAHACRQRCAADNIVAVLDARMGEVYWAQYRFDNGWHTVVAPRLSAPEDVAAHGATAACGNGLVAFADRIPGISALPSVHPEVMPHATAIASLGEQAWSRGEGLSADDAQPLYLRDKVALTTAERLQRSRA